MTTPRETTPGEGGAPPPGPQRSSYLGAPSPARPDAPTAAAPRPETPRSTSPQDPGPGWAAGRAPQDPQPTTVLPAGGRPPRPSPQRPVGGPRPAAGTAPRAAGGGGARPVAGRTRRARLSLRRIDPWSVFLFSLVAAVFLGVALVVAVAVLYAVLGSLGVTGSLNQLVAEVTGGNATTEPLLTGGRIIGGAAVLAAVNIVLLTLLATLGALLYNVCASFTGGLELTFGERD